MKNNRLVTVTIAIEFSIKMFQLSISFPLVDIKIVPDKHQKEVRFIFSSEMPSSSSLSHIIHQGPFHQQCIVLCIFILYIQLKSLRRIYTLSCYYNIQHNNHPDIVVLLVNECPTSVRCIKRSRHSVPSYFSFFFLSSLLLLLLCVSTSFIFFVQGIRKNIFSLHQMMCYVLAHTTCSSSYLCIIIRLAIMGLLFSMWSGNMLIF